MKHFYVRWGIDRLLRGEGVWPSSEAALRKHVAGCAACRDCYDEGVLLLRAATGRSGAPGLGEVERLMARAQQAAVEAPLPTFAWGRLGLAAAALLVLGVWAFSGGAAEVGVVVSAARLVVDGKEVQAGTRLREGQDVVASGGSAVIRLDGERVVLIKEGSRLRFEAAGARASVESGSAYFRVQKGVGRFEVTSGAATVVVKGTEFLVERRDLATTHVAVDEGLVEVRTRAGAVQVGAGQQTSVSGEVISKTTEIDLLEQIRRGLNRLGKELDSANRK